MSDEKEAMNSFIQFILSDNSPIAPEDQRCVDSFNRALHSATERLARARLERAKAGVAAAAQPSGVKTLDLERARRLLERARAGDESACVTLAARFGDGSMDGDMEAILEDLAELEEEDREKD